MAVLLTIPPDTLSPLWVACSVLLVVCLVQWDGKVWCLATPTRRLFTWALLFAIGLGSLLPVFAVAADWCNWDRYVALYGEAGATWYWYANFCWL